MSEGFEYMDDLIAKVLAGEASREEIDALEGWMNEAKENRLYFDETKKLFAHIDSFKEAHQVDTVKAWEKLHARIGSGQSTVEEARVIPLFKRRGFRAAAAIALLAVMAVVLNAVFKDSPSAPVIVAAKQKVVEQKLPDGSQVTLNKNSEIAYVQNGKVREVKLKGEAYFEVVHNEEQPFEIVIGDVVIKDIGTAFNVKALPNSSTIEVLVESGEVQFYSESSAGVNLVKGEKALYDKTLKQFTKLVPSPVENTGSYKSRIFVFKGESLREVVRQVNDIYGSDIVLDDERLGNCAIQTMFNNESIDSVIDIITETLDLTVERNGKKIVLKGQPCSE